MNLKKPKFWDYKKPNLFAYLLFPIAALLIINFNNFLKKKKKKKFKNKNYLCWKYLYWWNWKNFIKY